MAAAIFHRGPDSGGKFQLPHIALAIRRLSIIDLETGNQPLSNEAGDITLVFNGEIYNYRELCQGLLKRGHHFKTHSDGEAIIHLYEEQGPDCLRELNGMFAIALWDDRAKRLLLARDRAGEKPLYYWRDGQTLVFGSEIKSLLEYPGISRAIDPTALTHYFFYGHFPSPRSVYAEIKKLPAAHRMVVEGGNIHIDAYWRPQDYLRSPEQPPVTPRAGTRFGGRTRRAPAAGGGVAPGERRSPGRLPERRRGFLHHRRHHERAESGKRQFVFRKLPGEDLQRGALLDAGGETLPHSASCFERRQARHVPGA